MAGLSSTGFTTKTLEQIVDEILADTANALSVPQSSLGPIWRRLSLAPARQIHRLWQLLQLLYDKDSLQNASGVLLDHLAALAGITREGPRRARLSITVEGVTGTVLEAGKLIRRDGTEDDFQLTQEHTVAALAVDNEVVFEAVEAGALTLTSGDTYSIQTPVSGWTDVVTPTIISHGYGAETDEELRLRIHQAMNAPRSTHEAAIRRELLALSYVDEVLVVSNRTSTTVNGVNPHAIAVFVWPTGLTAVQELEVAETLFRAAPAGIELQASSNEETGGRTASVVDEQGYPQTVGWNYAYGFDIWIGAELTVTSEFPTDGVALVEAALAAQLNSYGIARGITPVQVAQFEAVARCAAPGITDVTIYIDGADPPVATNDFSLALGTRMVLQDVTALTEEA